MVPARRETDETALKRQKERYLAALGRTGTLTAGCRAARVSHNTVYQWREFDEAFSIAEHGAREGFADALEQEAVRRAWRGTKKPVYQGGKLVGHIQEHSDTLIIFMLKALRPGKFRDRVEHTGADGGPIQTEDVGLSLTDDQRAARIAAILDTARARRSGGASTD